MVINGGSRSNAGELAHHLLRADTNERVMVREIDGVSASDLRGALLEMEAMGSGSRSGKRLYHANIDWRHDETMTDAQKAQAVADLGRELGLENQPRAVVEHVKAGREHLHIVWLRIDTDTMTAISDSHNFRKHELVARELERQFGHERVQGAHIERDGVERPERCPSDPEMMQAARTSLDPEAAKARLRELWGMADTGKAFAATLEDAGWMLARGDKRGFVALDPMGGTHLVGKDITGLTAAKVRDRLADLDALPGVDAARQQLAQRQLARDEATRELDELAERQASAFALQDADRAAAEAEAAAFRTTLDAIRGRDDEASRSRERVSDMQRTLEEMAQTDPEGTAQRFGFRSGDRLVDPVEVRRQADERERQMQAAEDRQAVQAEAKTTPLPDPVAERAAWAAQLRKLDAATTPQAEPEQPLDPLAARAEWAARLRGFDDAKTPKPEPEQAQTPGHTAERAAWAMMLRKLDMQAPQPGPERAAARDPVADRAAWAVQLRGFATVAVPDPVREAKPVQGRDVPDRNPEGFQGPENGASGQESRTPDAGRPSRDFADDVLDEARRKVAREAAQRLRDILDRPGGHDHHTRGRTP